MNSANEKRQNLIHAADNLILQKGFRQTTLADIATESGVPLGNVYYYFRSKDAIGDTVIRRRLESLKRLLDDCSNKATPQQQLLAFLDYPLESRNTLVSHGCPLGTLCYELSRLSSPLGQAAGGMIQTLIDWARKRFQLMQAADPDSLALQFVCALQGMSLVANSLKQAQVIDTMVPAIRTWIETLDCGAEQTAATTSPCRSQYDE